MKEFGRGGDIVSVIAFYSDNPSSNPVKDYWLCSAKLFKNKEIK